MGSILHPNAKTTPRVRKEIQESKESINKLAEKLNLNPKTVAKWKKAKRVEDKKSGPIRVNTVLTELEEQIICEFRRTTKLPLDDVLISLKEHIPKLTRSNLHRCLKRHGLNVLPEEDKPKKEKKKFKEYQIGFVHIDICELRLEDKKYSLFVAIDRVSKYVYVEIHENKKVKTACEFLNNFIEDCPFKIHKILTDNGIQFTFRLMSEHRRPKKEHPFDEMCRLNSIEHRLTQFRHPWTNGQVEIMNKTIKNHTTNTYHYDNIVQLKNHLMAFITYYNLQKKLKSLKYKSPYEKIIEIYNKDNSLFRLNPYQKKMALNIYV